MSERNDSPGVRKSTVYFYGVSFLYTIVIGVAGGILLNRLVAFEPSAQDIPMLQNPSVIVELAGEGREQELYLEIEPPYQDQVHGRMILAPVFREAGIDVESDTVFRLVVSNRGDHPQHFENAAGDVVVQTKSGDVLASKAWPEDVDQPRLKQFLPGATVESNARSSFWFRIDQPLAFEDIISATVRLGDDNVVELKQIHSDTRGE